MAIEVPCPNCRSVLRAPDEAVGRRVKCKKCAHRFTVPGPTPTDGGIAESQFLSAIEVPAPLPPAPAVQPAAVRPAAVVAAVVVPAPVDIVPTVVLPAGVLPPTVPTGVAVDIEPEILEPDSAPAPPAAVDPGNPFAFDPRAEPSRTRSDDDEAPRSTRSSRSKAGGGAGKVLLIGGVIALVFLLGAGGAALGVYYFLSRPVATKPSLAVESVAIAPAGVETKIEKTTPEPKAATEPTKAKEVGKGKVGGNRPPPRGKDRGTAAAATTPDRSIIVPKTTAPAFQLPDPPSGAAKLIAPARDRVAIEVPAPQIKAVAFGGKNPRAVAVFWSVFAGFQGSGARDAVDVYSIASGRLSAHFELPADGFTGPRAFDLSPDGTRVAVEMPPGRMTVFDVDTKEKLLEGIDPFTGSPTPRTGLAGLKFVGSGAMLAAVDKAGAVDLWNVGTKARVAAGRPAGAAGSAPPALADLTSSQFWLLAQGAVTEISAQTADPGVSVTVADPAGAPLGLSLDATGRKGAAVFRDSGTNHGLAVLDLRPGKFTVTDKLTLPEKSGVPSGVTLVGGGATAAVQLADRSACLIFDAEHNVPAFYIKVPSGPPVKHFGDADADRLWWALPDGADPKKSLLVSVDANFDDYQQLVADAQTAKKPLYLIPRADGLAK